MTRSTDRPFDDRLRVVLVVLAVVVTVVAKPWAAHALLAGALVASVCASGVPLRTWAMRALAVSPVLLVVSLLVPFSRPGEPLFVVWGRAGWVVTEAGIRQWALVVARGGLAIGWLAFLGLSTTPERLVAAFRGLGLPAVLVALGWLTYRYLWVLADEAATLVRAWSARRTHTRRLHDMGALAGIVGVLFVRAVERAERVHLAMQARGFAGTPPVATSPPVERRDVLVAAILAAAGVCLLVAFR